MFVVLAEAFDEPAEPLSDEYVDQLLASTSFWAIAAFEGDRVVGGITAHTIPMTRSPRAELLVYDLAVHPDFRRRSVGAGLVTTLRRLAADAGVAEVFVPADEDDDDAVAFYRAMAGHESPFLHFAWDTARP
jgi:aminoglycoside 3-N-acetyltransferase I